MAENPFLDPTLAISYENWYATAGQRADRLEKALLHRLLARFFGAATLLEVGCGTGHFTRWFAQQGLQVLGSDASPAMLAEAARLGGPPCAPGDARQLPFAAGAFDLVALVTALEFMADPLPVLGEAMRVARRGLLLGVLNRRSRLGRQLQGSGRSPWLQARLFTPRELAELAARAAGQRLVEVYWRTTLWPLWPDSLPLPGGGFIGMAVHLQQDRAAEKPVLAPPDCPQEQTLALANSCDNLW